MVEIMKELELLREEAGKWNIELGPHELKRFEDYYNLLVSRNEKMNLTAITDPKEVVVKHFLDSLSVASVIDLKEVSSMIDVGTGAGFPGIPLKIAFPHIRVTLLDSLNKRVVFLNEVTGELGLEDIEAVHGRAETVSREKSYRESFDLCVSRAVADLSVLTELCTPFVKMGGRFVSYKSGSCDEEVERAENAIRVLGCSMEDVKKFMLFDSSRSFVVIRRDETCPKRYPRREGVPGKKPL